MPELCNHILDKCGLCQKFYCPACDGEFVCHSCHQTGCSECIDHEEEICRSCSVLEFGPEAWIFSLLSFFIRHRSIFVATTLHAFRAPKPATLPAMPSIFSWSDYFPAIPTAIFGLPTAVWANGPKKSLATFITDRHL